MARLQNCLCKDINFEPRVNLFEPQGGSEENFKTIELTMEELEAVRLRHQEKLKQVEAAKRMKTSQSTYQRILSSAYKKVTEALTKGKAIKIIRHL